MPPLTFKIADRYRTEDVVGEWRSLLHDSDVGRLPGVADALEDADYADAGLLTWLRSPTTMSVLGREHSRVASITSSLFPELQGQAVELATRFLRDAFCKRYEVIIPPDSINGVQFSVDGRSRPIDILNDADSVAELSSDTQRIHPDLLRRWSTDPQCLKPYGQRYTFTVTGCVPHSDCLSREEQVRLGRWNDVSTKGLAIASQAFLLKSNRDLLDGHWVRTGDGVLNSTRRYLSEDPDERYVERAMRNLYASSSRLYRPADIPGLIARQDEWTREPTMWEFLCGATIHPRPRR